MLFVWIKSLFYWSNRFLNQRTSQTRSREHPTDRFYLSPLVIFLVGVDMEGFFLSCLTHEMCFKSVIGKTLKSKKMVTLLMIDVILFIFKQNFSCFGSDDSIISYH